MRPIYTLCAICAFTSVFSQAIRITLDIRGTFTAPNLLVSVSDSLFYTNENPIVLPQKFRGARVEITHVTFDTLRLTLNKTKTSAMLVPRVYTSGAHAEHVRMSPHTRLAVSSISENDNQFSAVLKSNINLIYSNYGAEGAVQEFKFRGLPAVHNRVMIEGVPLNSEQLGGLNLATLSTLNADAVSIYADGNNGNESSGQFGAAINSTTRSFFGHRVKSAISAGSYNRYRRQIEAESYAGNLAFYAGFRSQGSSNNFEYQRSNSETAHRNGADYEFQDFHVQATLARANSLTKFIYKHSENNAGVPGPKKNSTAPFQRGAIRQLDTSDLLILKHQAELGGEASLMLTASLNPQRLKFHTTSDSKNTYTFFKAAYSDALTENLRFSASVEDRYIALSARQGAAEYTKVHNYLRSFTRLAWHAKKHELSGALRASAAHNYAIPATYEFGYTYAATSALRAAARVSTHYRIPTFNELYYPNANNPNLKPEEGTKRSFAVIYQTEKIDVRLTYFEATLWNYVLWLNQDGGLKPLNQPRVRQSGYEASASYALGGFRFSGQYLQNRLEDGTRTQLVSVPKQQFLLSASYASRRLRASVLHKWTDEFAIFGVTKPHPRFNDLSAQLELQQPFRLGETLYTAALFANGYNLLNRLSPPQAPYPRPNRNFDIGIKLNINLGD